MARFERDLLMRQIQQLGAAVAALLQRARTEGDDEAALASIRSAAGQGLGVDRALLDRLDAASAVLLLQDAERARVYAQVCAAEAELLERLGRPAEAEGLKRRATEVESAAQSPR